MAQFTDGHISTAHARKLVQNYLRNKWKPAKLKSVDETQSCWFSKKTLLNILGLPDNTHTGEVDGARFYFAAYENTNNPEEPPKNKEYKDHMTLVIVQTKAGNVASPHVDMLDEPEAFPDYDVAFKEYNDGQLCPPPKCDRVGSLLDEHYVTP